MSQLTFTSIPGFTDIQDTVLSANQPLTDSDMLAISHNAKYGIVRCEIIYMGFYIDGNTVAAPMSPVDGYQYAYSECAFIPIFCSSRQPAAGFVAGQAAFPVLANSDLGTGALVVVPYELDVNDATGLVTCKVYFNGNGSQAQGVAKVYAICQRSSVNQAN